MIQSREPDAASDTSAPTPISTGGSGPAPDRWWLVPAALVAGFLLLLWQVESHGPVTGLDIRVRDHLQRWAASTNWMYKPGRGMADLGDQSVTLLVLFAATALAIRAARSWRPALVAVGSLLALAAVIPLKLWISRPGPGQVTLGDAALGFFPSGHTADSALCYGTGALLLCTFVVPVGRRYTRALRWAITAAAVALVLMTIFGLLWSDFHWLSDTLASLCWCGAALVLVDRLLLRRFALGAAGPAGQDRVGALGERGEPGGERG